MIRRLVLMCVSLALCLTTACTSDGDGDKTSAPPSKKPSSTAKKTGGLVQPSKVPPKVPNTPSLRSAVTMSGCAQATNGWKASGTAKNTRKKAFTYVITVFFTTPTATVIGFGKTTVDVDAGKSAKWTVTSKFTAVKNTKCVLRGVAKG